MCLTGSGSSISDNKFSGTLSTPRYGLAATTINYNGVDYVAFGGGYSDRLIDIVDFMYLTGSGSSISVNKFSETLSTPR